jgi:hypothetical protein
VEKSHKYKEEKAEKEAPKKKQKTLSVDGSKEEAEDAKCRWLLGRAMRRIVGPALWRTVGWAQCTIFVCGS